MASVPSAGALFSPLDKELGLLPGELTPQLQEQCTRLGQATDSFQEAADLVASFTRVRVSESTVRRLTEGGGAALLAVETAAASTAASPWGTVEAPSDRLFLSVDGAMVPLLHGEWREVKTLVVAEPEAATGLPKERADQEVTCGALSYFSRLTDCHTFSALAAVEIKRRRVGEARWVAGGSDAAEWCQGVFDAHRPDAVRILDFEHASGYVEASGKLLFGEGTDTTQQWISEQLHRLKHEGGTPVVDTLRTWEGALRSPAEKQLLAKNRDYLEKREELLRYPAFRADGWPIGTGCVESGNKRVVERRLKGAGMHWAEANVDPMLALRNATCSGRWEAAWQQIAAARGQGLPASAATAAKT